MAVPAQAQAPVAAVSITCQPAEIKVDVKPGSTLVGFTTCTATNPSSYLEKISVSISSDGLAAAAPGDIYVGPNSEEDFQVVVRAQPFMTMQARTLTVQASVSEFNGLPPPNPAQSSSQMIVSITQFALLQVEAVEPFVQLMPKTDKDFEFKVYNLGNQYDFMKVGISENSRESLEDAGFNINIPISKVNVEPMVAPAKVRIQLRTPKTQGWTDAYHTLDFYAESDFSCKNGGCDRESQMITIYVRGIYLPGFEIIPALSMVALAAAVAGRRFINADDEEEEWRESAPGL
ncbi:MAG: hypothetical protein CMA60_04470 [Euryarchaeota archaeon]|nr:hypothetical protein [Euryarchaeota archaeon]